MAMLRGFEELDDIRSILIRHDEMLLRILGYLKQMGRNGRLNHHIRDRRLRLLYTMYLFNENLCISKLAKVIDADRKTVRRDLALLTKMGLVSYDPRPNSRYNPGRKGCKPKLTKRGKVIALKAYDLDGEELWLKNVGDL